MEEKLKQDSQNIWASLVAQLLKNPPAMWGRGVGGIVGRVGLQKETKLGVQEASRETEGQIVWKTATLLGKGRW